MPHLWRRLLLVTALAVLVFAGFGLYADLSELGGRLRLFAPATVAAALALALGNYALRFARWTLYLRRVDAHPPLGRSLLVFVGGFLFSITPGKVGELVKAILLREAAGVPVARTAPVVIAERVTDLVALVVLSLLGVAAYGVARTTALISAGVVLVGLAVVSSRRLAHGLIELLSRIAAVRRHAPRLREMYAGLYQLVRPAPLAWATLLATAAWLCECFGFALVVRGFPGAGVALGLAVLIYATTTIAGALSFLPGGLLVTEGAMTVLLVTQARGLDRPTAVAATIVIRLCTLWFAVLLGLVAFLVLRRLAPAVRSVERAPAGTVEPEG